MHLSQPPDRLIDRDDGQPIEQLSPQGSRYDTIAIKRGDNGVEVRAKEAGTDEVVEIETDLSDQMYRGVTTSDGTRRRDIDDDILDALHQAGYAIIDPSVQRY